MNNFTNDRLAAIFAFAQKNGTAVNSIEALNTLDGALKDQEEREAQQRKQQEQNNLFSAQLLNVIKEAKTVMGFINRINLLIEEYGSEFTNWLRTITFDFTVQTAAQLRNLATTPNSPVTQRRNTVLEIIKSADNGLSANDIYTALKDKFKDTKRQTVYNDVNTLCRQRKLIKVGLPHNLEGTHRGRSACIAYKSAK